MGKELWEMTAEEFGVDLPILDGRHRRAFREARRRTHREIVREAVRQGKPVPNNVLGEYPEITHEKPGIEPAFALAIPVAKKFEDFPPNPRKGVDTAA